MKKSILSVLIFTLCCTLVFNMFSFAQNVPESQMNNGLLLTPRVGFVYQTNDDLNNFEIKMDNMYMFDLNPYIKPTYLEGTIKTSSVTGESSSFTGNYYVKKLTRSCYHTYKSGEEAFRMHYYLTNADESSVEHYYYANYQFESFHIRTNVDQFAWYLAKTQTDVVDPQFTCEVLSYDYDTDSYFYDKVSFTLPWDHNNFVTISSIYDAVADKAVILDGGIYFRSMQVKVLNTWGMLAMYCADVSVNNSVQQFYIMPLIQSDNGIANPSIIDWLSDSVGGFFGTSVFKFGTIDITFGSLIILPLSLCLLVVLLKKFAGG